MAGSVIQTSLDFKWLKRGWVANGIYNPEAQPFEIWTIGHNFVKNYLKSGQKSPDFEWSGFQMVSNGWDYSYSHNLNI